MVRAKNLLPLPWSATGGEAMDIKELLTFWGYTQKWLDYGVITIEQLEADLIDFQKAPYNYNKEHYRSAHLYRYLDHFTTITDRQIEEILELSWADEDSGFIDHYLLKHHSLSDDQFEKLAQLLLREEIVSKHVIRKQRLWRRFCREGATQQVIDDAISEPYPKIQRQLLEQYALPEEILMIFVEQGSNKGIRGHARYLLQKLRRDNE